MKTLVSMLAILLALGIAGPAIGDGNETEGAQEQLLLDECPIVDEGDVMLGADARIYDAEQRGCCSWHGGVCGCRGGRTACCDGSLSPSCRC